MIVILLLLFETPIRKHLLAQLDELKTGKAQFVLKSIGVIVFVVMMYNIYSAYVNFPNQVLLVYRLLQAYLIGNFRSFALIMS